MTRTLYIVGGLVGAFVLWQWWLGRRQSAMTDADAARKAADRIGQAQEVIQQGGRPRLMSDEQLWALPAITGSINALWSQIFSDGSASTGPDKVATEPDRNPFIFGYGN